MWFTNKDDASSQSLGRRIGYFLKIKIPGCVPGMYNVVESFV